MLSKIFSMLAGERKDLVTGELATTEQLHASGLRMYETPDPVPMAPPVGYKREPSIMETIKGQLLAAKIERLREELGAETAEEAEDFDTPDPDDFEPSSEWEHDRHDMEVLMAYEKLQNHRLLMDEKYGTTTADKNVDAAAKKAADEKTAKLGVEGASPPPKAPAVPSEPA